jgi:hypothetical protein
MSDDPNANPNPDPNPNPAPGGDPNPNPDPAPNPDPDPNAGGDRLDFVLDRYRADGRTEQEAALEQAKGYNELRSQFGAFTGAPEEYTAQLSDELVEAGVALDSDDPLLESAMTYAKEANMSQEGFNGMIELYAKAQLAEAQALEEHKAEQMKALGPNASKRIEGINSWIDANMDAETAEGLRGVIQTADGLKAVEQLIAKTRNAPVAPGDADPAPSITSDEVKAMQFAKDEHGNRKINVDPAFRKEYERKRDALYGTQEHRQMVGG